MPRTGRPILKISGSYTGASALFTELGPPEIIMALQGNNTSC